MTDLTTRPRPPSQTAAGPSQVPAEPAPEPALISEQQLLFSTAAAVAFPPAKTRRWASAIDAAVAGAMRSFFAGRQEPVRHHPKRHAYLENALMARQMDRL